MWSTSLHAVVGGGEKAHEKTSIFDTCVIAVILLVRSSSSSCLPAQLVGPRKYNYDCCFAAINRAAINYLSITLPIQYTVFQSRKKGRLPGRDDNQFIAQYPSSTLSVPFLCNKNMVVPLKLMLSLDQRPVSLASAVVGLSRRATINFVFICTSSGKMKCKLRCP